jgi:hypothetical protein
MPASDYQPFLDQLASTLRPHLTDLLGEQFGLTAEQATEALPAVAEPLFDGLRAKAKEPTSHLDTLTALYRTLSDTDQATDPSNATPASAGDDLMGLVEQVAGRDLGALGTQVADRLGLGSGATGKLVVLAVVPKLFAALRHLTEQEDIGAVVKPLVDEATAQQLEPLLGMLKGSGKLGDLLGGLFG